MTDELDPQQDRKRKLASGPLAWAKKRVDALKTRRLAETTAQSVAAKIVAGALAGALGGGTVVAAERAGVLDLTPEVQLNAGAIALVESNVTSLEDEATKLKAIAEDLNTRIEGLAGLLSATDAVNDEQVDQILERIDGIAESADLATREVERKITALAGSLDDVVMNQTLDAARLSDVATRVNAVVLELDGAKLLAEDALDEALTAQGIASAAANLASEALDGVAAVAEQVATLADQVDAVAESVAANAASLDDLAAQVDDLEQRMIAEEAEPAVVENAYDDSELRNRISELESLAPVASWTFLDLNAASTTVTETVTFTTEDGPTTNEFSGRTRIIFTITFSPNNDGCVAMVVYVDDLVLRSINASNSAGRGIVYTYSRELLAGEHTLRIELDPGAGSCLVIAPTVEVRT